MANMSFIRKPIRYSFYNATIILLAANILVFLIEMLDRGGSLTDRLALTPAYVIQGGAWWQIVTYMFVHANFWHIFFNMLSLFLFGIQLEQRMGSTEFLLYYFVCGIGAGLATLLVNYLTGMAGIPVVGASGAIFGLLLAFATFFPDARIFIFGILPMRAPIAVLIFAGINLFNQFTSPGSGVAYLTHLAGIVFGYLYILVRYGINPIKVFFHR
jgi:membrane associated rhomboid family serine protease